MMIHLALDDEDSWYLIDEKEEKRKQENFERFLNEKTGVHKFIAPLFSDIQRENLTIETECSHDITMLYGKNILSKTLR